MRRRPQFAKPGRATFWMLIVASWLATTAGADIVYSSAVGGWMQGGQLDINGDAIPELTFSATFLTTHSIPPITVDMYSVGLVGHVETLTGGRALQLQQAGQEIGADAGSGTWGTSRYGFTVLTRTHIPAIPPTIDLTGSWSEALVAETILSGPLADAGGLGFLGVRFLLEDGVHYGWVRMSNRPVHNPGAPLPFTLGPHIVDWAYESVPGTPILAGAVPEPSVFGLCLAGLAALVAAWRRR